MASGDYHLSKTRRMQDLPMTTSFPDVWGGLRAVGVPGFAVSGSRMDAVDEGRTPML